MSFLEKGVLVGSVSRSANVDLPSLSRSPLFLFPQ